jgi:hypothetical protein
MHVQLPKPLHGWRAFAGEVGVVVLGVLLALGAQQVVESLHERETIEQVRSAVLAELGEDRARWEYLRVQDHCISTRLAALDLWAAKAPQGAAIRRYERPSLWSVHASAWDLAKSSPVVDGLPLKERLTISSAYDMMGRGERYLIDEDQDWKAINALTDAPLTEQRRAELTKAIASARYDVQRRQNNYGLLFERLDALGIHSDPKIAGALGSPRELCAPLDA